MSPEPSLVIVGASLAGATAAQTLREKGFTGRVVLLGDETHRPCLRPSLSKGYPLGASGRETVFVHPEGWYAEQPLPAPHGRQRPDQGGVRPWPAGGRHRRRLDRSGDPTSGCCTASSRKGQWCSALAATSMLGRAADYDRLPYFFTDQYELGMEYTGHVDPDGYDQVVSRGDVPGRESSRSGWPATASWPA